MPISYIMHNKLQFMNFDLIEAQLCPALAHCASISKYGMSNVIDLSLHTVQPSSTVSLVYHILIITT